jgi:phospholipase/carboxylesterase
MKQPSPVLTPPSPTPTQKFTGLIVSVHGNGSTPEFMAAFSPLLNLPDYQFLFPKGLFSHPDVPGGKMWYDLSIQNNKPKIQNSQRLGESRQWFITWLKSLEGIVGIPLSRTILMGFSQGGAMTLDVGLTLPLAGLVCISGYLHSKRPPTLGKASPPTLIVHGTKDSIIPLDEAHLARDTLSALNVPVKYQEFEIGHEIKPEVLVLVREFILTVMQQ